MFKAQTPSKKQSLQEQIKHAQPGDCIELSQGIYHPGTLILPQGGDKNAPIIIQPRPGHHVILRGDGPLPGEWEQVDAQIWRMPIPLNFTNPIGDLFAGQTTLNEVTSLDQLQENKWGYLNAIPFPVTPLIDTQSTHITSDDQHIFDLDKLSESPLDLTQRHILRTFIHAPKTCTGSLHLDHTQHINGQWPMARVNDFYGYRRADEPFAKLKQSIAITLNGQQLNDWNQHSPLLKQVPWQAGWNELVIQLDAEAGRPHRFKLTASMHHWSVNSEQGFYASPTQMALKTLPCVEKGLILKDFYWHGSHVTPGRFIYLCLKDDGLHPDDLNITASQQSCLLTQGDQTCSHVIIRGLHFQRTATSPKHGMIDLGNNASHWQIDHCTFTHSTGGCINIDTGQHHHITNCQFQHVGCTAIQAWAPQRHRNRHLKISECHFSHCNSKRFGLGWHAACIKVCRTAQCIIEHCDMQDNACHGIWLDWECEENLITSNILKRCKGSGIFLEASRWNNRVIHNHVSHTAVGLFGGNGIYIHDTCDSYIAYNRLNHNAGFGLRFGLATNRVMDFNIPIRRESNVIVHNQMCSNGEAAMDIPQERPGVCMNFYDHNVYIPAKFVLVHNEDINKIFNAETGQSPVIRRFEINSLAELQQRTGQDANSRDQI